MPPSSPLLFLVILTLNYLPTRPVFEVNCRYLTFWDGKYLLTILPQYPGKYLEYTSTLRAYIPPNYPD